MALRGVQAIYEYFQSNKNDTTTVGDSESKGDNLMMTGLGHSENIPKPHRGRDEEEEKKGEAADAVEDMEVLSVEFAQAIILRERELR